VVEYSQHSGGERMKRKLVRMLLCLMLVVSTAVTPAALAASYPPVAIMMCTVEGGRLRQGPSSSYDVITSLQPGDRVFYMNETVGAFYLVRTSTGMTGYIYKEFLQYYGAARADQIYFANYDGVKVYKQPSAGSGRAGSLSLAEHVIIYKVVGEWGLVKTLYGGTGYVRMSDVTQVA